MKKIIAAVIILCMLLNGCMEEETPEEEDIRATPEKVEAVVEANNQFTFDLYQQLKDNEDNIFYSPYSITTALTMTYEGARGQTAEEMQETLHIPENPETRRPAHAEIYKQINKPDKEYTLHTANALWAQKDYRFLEEYLDLTEKYYAGKTTNVDFKTETEKTRQTINTWVEEQTNNKIKDLIPEGVLDPLTKLVLTNAIYFKGDWVLKFDKEKTHEADFKVNTDKTVKTQMMTLKGEKAVFNYTETEDAQILELPYKGQELSMLIILPKEDLQQVEEKLNTENLKQWKNMLQEQEMDVYMPKFKFETKYYMKETLKEMGMETAFTWPAADFSGMDGTRNLYIDQVIHQAYVEVNEEGTEAAAATAVVIKLGAITSKVFRADHPFIFIIQEKETGNILFLGRVTDPTE